MKKCTKCGESFPATSEFFGKDKNMRDGLFSWCRSCCAAKSRAYYAAHREERLAYQAKWKLANDDYLRERRRANREAMEDRRRVTRYGLTPEDYAALVERQSGTCAICGAGSGDRVNGLHIDHDHQTGRVRGLLCSNCNRGLGHLQDAPGILAVAIAYLEAAS